MADPDNSEPNGAQSPRHIEVRGPFPKGSELVDPENPFNKGTYQRQESRDGKSGIIVKGADGGESWMSRDKALITNTPQEGRSFLEQAATSGVPASERTSQPHTENSSSTSPVIPLDAYVPSETPHEEGVTLDEKQLLIPSTQATSQHFEAPQDSEDELGYESFDFDDDSWDDVEIPGGFDKDAFEEFRQQIEASKNQTVSPEPTAGSGWNFPPEASEPEPAPEPENKPPSVPDNAFVPLDAQAWNELSQASGGGHRAIQRGGYERYAAKDTEKINDIRDRTAQRTGAYEVPDPSVSRGLREATSEELADRTAGHLFVGEEPDGIRSPESSRTNVQELAEDYSDDPDIAAMRSQLEGETPSRAETPLPPTPEINLVGRTMKDARTAIQGTVVGETTVDETKFLIMREPGGPDAPIHYVPLDNAQVEGMQPIYASAEDIPTPRNPYQSEIDRRMKEMALRRPEVVARVAENWINEKRAPGEGVIETPLTPSPQTGLIDRITGRPLDFVEEDTQGGVQGVKVMEGNSIVFKPLRDVLINEGDEWLVPLSGTIRKVLDKRDRDADEVYTDDSALAEAIRTRQGQGREFGQPPSPIGFGAEALAAAHQQQGQEAEEAEETPGLEPLPPIPERFRTFIDSGFVIDRTDSSIRTAYQAIDNLQKSAPFKTLLEHPLRGIFTAQDVVPLLQEYLTYINDGEHFKDHLKNPNPLWNPWDEADPRTEFYNRLKNSVAFRTEDGPNKNKIVQATTNLLYNFSNERYLGAVGYDIKTELADLLSLLPIVSAGIHLKGNRNATIA